MSCRDRWTNVLRGGWLFVGFAVCLWLSPTGCRPTESNSTADRTPIASSTATPGSANATNDESNSVAGDIGQGAQGQVALANVQADVQAVRNAGGKSDVLKGRERSILRPGGVYDLTFDNLEFAIEPDEDFRRAMLSEAIEEFDGKQVIIRGFILDSSVFTQKGIKQFVLIRDNQVCCFGPGAKIFHNMMVDMNPGKSADFTIRPVTARGVLKIQPWISPADGKTYSVFHLDAESVK